MLYDEFNKFTSEPGESIHSYYLRFAKLINDMNMIPMSMTPMKINTKFVNHLQPEWSSYAPTIVQQLPAFQPDTGLAIPTFLPTDDPIASLNKSMIFLSLVYRSKFPPTNNQLQTSSNPKTQATIQNGQVTVKNVQCAARKRVKDYEWFKEKMLLAEETDDCEDLQLQAIANFKADYVDAYDSNCDDEATANAIFMANLSSVSSLNDGTVVPRYDSDIHSEVPRYDIRNDEELKGTSS
ncbi:hypothetical protein Tco_1135025 [Tanacetum coccineum]